MKLLNFTKNIIVGKNNYIEKGVKIFNNVIIGDNNKIYNGTIIYPNTKIGNNNVILNNNVIGEHPIEAKEIFNEKKFGGVEIGNNNFFHNTNIIYSGYYNKTIMGNNNKILGECHIGHDVHIYNMVHIYTRSMLCGLVNMYDFSGSGASCVIHQKKNIGQFSFLGMNNTITKNSFPFFININNKYHKINYHRINGSSPEFKKKIENSEKILYNICSDYEKKHLNLLNYKDMIDDDIYNIIQSYLSHE